MLMIAYIVLLWQHATIAAHRLEIYANLSVIGLHRIAPSVNQYLYLLRQSVM